MKKNRYMWSIFIAIVSIVVLLILYAITFSLIPEASWMPPWFITLIQTALAIKTSMIEDYIFYSLIVAIIGALSVGTVFLRTMTHKSN